MSKNERENLKTLLRKLKKDQVSPEAKQKAKKFFKDADAETIGRIEQELIQEGVSREEIKDTLCSIHLEVLGDQLVSKRIEVEAPHPVHTLMEEHKIILGKLEELRSLLKRLKDARSFDDMGDDLEKLKNISHHLLEAESHHQREEDTLFPRLEEYGVVEPPEIMKMEHVELKGKKQSLHDLAANPKEHYFEDFKEKVLDTGNFIATNLEDHIFKEDNILYQMALEVLSEDEWDAVRKESDKIGYCCFTPSA